MTNPFRTSDTIASRGRAGGGGVKSSGPSAPPMPPDLPNLLHWFDLTDNQYIFSDAIGTIPAVDGGPVRNITNRGTDGTPMDQVTNPGEEPIYRKGLGLNGLDYVEFAGIKNIFGIVALGQNTIANGATMAQFFRRNGSTTINQTPFFWGVRHHSSIGSNTQGPFEGRFQLGDAGNIFGIISPTMALNTWYLMYATSDALGPTNDTTFGSPGPESIVTNVPDTNVPNGQDIRFGTTILAQAFDMSEAFYWNGPLLTQGRTDLVTYGTAKYGALPA